MVSLSLVWWCAAFLPFPRVVVLFCCFLLGCSTTKRDGGTITKLNITSVNMNKLNFCSTNEFKKCLMLFHFIQTKGNGCPHPNEGEESSTTRRGEGREAPQPTWGGVVLSSLFGVMLPFFSLLWVGLFSPLFCGVVLLGLLLLWVLLFFSPFWSCCLPSLLWVVVLSPLRRLGWFCFFWEAALPKRKGRKAEPPKKRIELLPLLLLLGGAPFPSPSSGWCCLPLPSFGGAAVPFF